MLKNVNFIEYARECEVELLTKVKPALKIFNKV